MKRISTHIAAPWPVNVFLFMLPDKILLYRYGYAPWNRDKLLDRRTYALSQTDDHEAALARALTDITSDYRPRTDDSWYLGLPLRHFTFLDFGLPLAASENLDQAVRYALMRHVPFDLDSTHVRYDTQTAGEQILVRATVAPMDELAPILQAAEEAGITVSAVLPSLAFMARLNGKSGMYVSGGAAETEILGWKEGRIVFSAWDMSDEPEAGKTFLVRSQPAMANAPLPQDSPCFLWEQRLEPQEVAQTLGLDELGQPGQPSPLDQLSQPDLPNLPNSPGLAVLDQPPQGPCKALSSFAYQIGLVPEMVLRRRRISFWVQAAAMLLVLLAVASIPLAHLSGMRAQLRHLDQRIAEISTTTDALTRMRARDEQIVAELHKVADMQTDKTLPAEVLRELTAILPHDVWLTTLVLNREHIDMRGTAASATTVIERIESSSLFSGARFDSPVTKREDKELFKVLANLAPRPRQGG